jgi:hypothetical protein
MVAVTFNLLAVTFLVVQVVQVVVVPPLLTKAVVELLDKDLLEDHLLVLFIQQEEAVEVVEVLALLEH